VKYYRNSRKCRKVRRTAKDFVFVICGFTWIHAKPDYKGSRNDPCKAMPSIRNRRLQQKASQEAFDNKSGDRTKPGKWCGMAFEASQILSYYILTLPVKAIIMSL